MTVRLGLGLIGIGRPWPSDSDIVPDENDVFELLDCAVERGVGIFDTAPAYGLSEERLGAFLQSSRPETRAKIKVFTKVGEQWSQEAGSVVDHSLGALQLSIEKSVRLLGQIDLLQVHKATAELLMNDVFLADLLSIARSYGITELGVSARDERTCEVAVDSGVFSHVQVPFNLTYRELERWILQNRTRVRVIVNRPFSSGGLRGAQTEEEAASFVTSALQDGIVLVGTRQRGHLNQNIELFSRASAEEVQRD